jgi:hypothetical protein
LKIVLTNNASVGAIWTFTPAPAFSLALRLNVQPLNVGLAPFKMIAPPPRYAELSVNVHSLNTALLVPPSRAPPPDHPAVFPSKVHPVAMGLLLPQYIAPP